MKLRDYYGLNHKPQKLYVEVLTLVSHKGPLFGNEVIKDLIIKMKSQWIRMGSQSNMTDAPEKNAMWKERDTHRGKAM